MQSRRQLMSLHRVINNQSRAVSGKVTRLTSLVAKRNTFLIQLLIKTSHIHFTPWEVANITTPWIKKAIQIMNGNRRRGSGSNLIRKSQEKKLLSTSILSRQMQNPLHRGHISVTNSIAWKGQRWTIQTFVCNDLSKPTKQARLSGTLRNKWHKRKE